MTTFHKLLREGSRRHGARNAILFNDVTISYETLLERTEAFARGFSSAGVTADDHVAIIMENSIECVFSWLASSVLGCTEVPLNPQYRGDLLLYLLRDSESSVIVCDVEFLGQVLAVAAQLPRLRLIVVNGSVPQGTDGGRVTVIDLAACILDGPPLAPAANTPERVILYTSGTTGPSKGVVHTQKSCLSLARYNAEMMRYDEADRLLNFFPLYHQNARYTGVIPALYAGASIRLERRFSSSTFWRTCDSDGITAFNYLSSVLRLVMNVTPPERGVGTHTVKKAFGAGAPPGIWALCQSRLGIDLIETYGLSEAPMATINTRQAGRVSPIGSAGRTGDLFEVAIVDEDDHLLPSGEVGEIVLRPRAPDVMMIGYHNKDAATVKAFRNLWFHSGDRGRLSRAW